jgi:hypothetical protein
MLILSKINYVADMGHPMFAVIDIDEAAVHQAIGRIDLVRETKSKDGHLYGMSFWNYAPAYIEESDQLDMLMGDSDWMTVTKEQLEAHGIAFDPQGRVDTEYRTETDRQLAFEDEIQWRAYPKYGDGEFTTARISRDELDKILIEMGVPA